MSAFKISTLFVSAAVLGISIANAVYFNRIYKTAVRTPASTRNLYFGSNAAMNARIMWWLNVILAIIAGVLFVFTIFKMAGVGKSDKTMTVSTSPATAPAVQVTTTSGVTTI